MIRWCLLILALNFAILVPAQKELIFHRFIYDNLSNPAQLHLQGKFSAKIGAGSNFLPNISKSNTGYSFTYYCQPIDLAFRIKSETNFYEKYIFKRNTASWNIIYKVKKKNKLSLGLDAQLLKAKLDFQPLHYASGADSLFQFTLTSSEQSNKKRTIVQVSFNIGMLFYDTTGHYFLGVLCNDITQPVWNFFPQTGPGSPIYRELNIYGGYRFRIADEFATISTSRYRRYGYTKQFSFRQDLLWRNKFLLGYESNLKELNRLYAGFQPSTKWNFILTTDFQPNAKSYIGSTNYYKLNLGYVW